MASSVIGSRSMGHFPSACRPKNCLRQVVSDDETLGSETSDVKSPRQSTGNHDMLATCIRPETNRKTHSKTDRRLSSQLAMLQEQVDQQRKVDCMSTVFCCSLLSFCIFSINM